MFAKTTNNIVIAIVVFAKFLVVFASILFTIFHLNQACKGTLKMESKCYFVTENICRRPLTSMRMVPRTCACADGPRRKASANLLKPPLEELG